MSESGSPEWLCHEGAVAHEETMKILLPTMRDPGQIGGTSTHIAMLVKGLRELGCEAEALYLGGTLPSLVRNALLIWPAGLLNRLRSGWGMMYAAEARARLLTRATGRELQKGWTVLNAQEVYSVPYCARRRTTMECLWCLPAWVPVV